MTTPDLVARLLTDAEWNNAPRRWSSIKVRQWAGHSAIDAAMKSGK